MIKILKNHKAKAIFFINGIHDKNNKDVIGEIAKDGFAVGNHTWNHVNLKRTKDTVLIENEINNNSELIKNLTGNNPRFFRPPYGESTGTIRKMIKDKGMIFMNWSGAAKDWEKATQEKDIFVSNVMNDLHSGSIILIHEHPWSLANLDALLSKMDSEGYSYVDPADIIE
jgi:peptidoglycan/xylan/chitin deacetylase (PgdA/CDA1 family)